MPKRINQLDTPSIPLTGGELVELSQYGTSVQLNLNQLKTWLQTSGPSGVIHNELSGLQGGVPSAGEFYHLPLDIYNGLFSGSPLIGLGDKNGTNLRVKYGGGDHTLSYDISGSDRLYFDNNVFMVGDTQFDFDPPNASGSFIRLERGRDGVTNFNQYNVHLEGQGAGGNMINVIHYNLLDEIQLSNSDLTGNLLIHGSAAFSATPDSLTYRAGGITAGFQRFEIGQNAQIIGDTNDFIRVDQSTNTISLSAGNDGIVVGSSVKAQVNGVEVFDLREDSMVLGDEAGVIGSTFIKVDTNSEQIISNVGGVVPLDLQPTRVVLGDDDSVDPTYLAMNSSNPSAAILVSGDQLLNLYRIDDGYGGFDNYAQLGDVAQGAYFQAVYEPYYDNTVLRVFGNDTGNFDVVMDTAGVLSSLNIQKGAARLGASNRIQTQDGAGPEFHGSISGFVNMATIGGSVSSVFLLDGANDLVRIGTSDSLKIEMDVLESGKDRFRVMKGTDDFITISPTGSQIFGLDTGERIVVDQPGNAIGAIAFSTEKGEFVQAIDVDGPNSTLFLGDQTAVHARLGIGSSPQFRIMSGTTQYIFADTSSARLGISTQANWNAQYGTLLQGSFDNVPLFQYRGSGASGLEKVLALGDIDTLSPNNQVDATVLEEVRVGLGNTNMSITSGGSGDITLNSTGTITLSAATKIDLDTPTQEFSGTNINFDATNSIALSAGGDGLVIGNSIRHKLSSINVFEQTFDSENNILNTTIGRTTDGQAYILVADDQADPNVAIEAYVEGDSKMQLYDSNQRWGGYPDAFLTTHQGVGEIRGQVTGSVTVFLLTEDEQTLGNTSDTYFQVNRANRRILADLDGVSPIYLDRASQTLGVSGSNFINVNQNINNITMSSEQFSWSASGAGFNEEIIFNLGWRPQIRLFTQDGGYGDEQFVSQFGDINAGSYIETLYSGYYGQHQLNMYNKTSQNGQGIRLESDSISLRTEAGNTRIAAGNSSTFMGLGDINGVVCRVQQGGDQTGQFVVEGDGADYIAVYHNRFGPSPDNHFLARYGAFIGGVGTMSIEVSARNLPVTDGAIRFKQKKTTGGALQAWHTEVEFRPSAAYFGLDTDGNYGVDIDGELRVTPGTGNAMLDITENQVILGDDAPANRTYFKVDLDNQRLTAEADYQALTIEGLQNRFGPLGRVNIYMNGSGIPSINDYMDFYAGASDRVLYMDGKQQILGRDGQNGRTHMAMYTSAAGLGPLVEFTVEANEVLSLEDNEQRIGQSGDANISLDQLSNLITAQAASTEIFRLQNTLQRLGGSGTTNVEVDQDPGEVRFTVDGNADALSVSAGQLTGQIFVTIEDVLRLKERTSDPQEPIEGTAIIWLSDGTGKGDDGDVMIASKVDGNTRFATLFDHSAGSPW